MIDRGSAAHECLSEEALSRLKEYKYSSVDKSYISYYILRHYWNGFVELLPLWLAPNLVTLLGFFCILVNIALLGLLIPDLIGPGPSWLYFSFAAGLWMYSTMDNVDGKQARRTGSSSPLGELFDHGIDSLNCTLGSLLETAAMGLGASKTGAFTAMIPCLPMFFSTWETYHTHTLYLGYFNGPTEGLILACSVMVISGLYGPQVWKSPIGTLVDLHESLIPYSNLTPRDFWVPTLLFAFFAAHLPSCIVNVARARRSRNEPVLPTFLHWIPMIIYTFGVSAWLSSPWSITLKENHLLLFCLTQSLVFGRFTTKIILAHLTKQAFPYWTVLLWPLIIAAIGVNLPRLGFEPINPSLERIWLWVYFAFSIVVYFRWATLVINSICSYLGINCFTIPHPPKQTQQQTRSTPARKAKSANGKAH